MAKNGLVMHMKWIKTINVKIFHCTITGRTKYIFAISDNSLTLHFGRLFSTYQKLQRENKFALEYGFFGRIIFLRVRFIFLFLIFFYRDLQLFQQKRLQRITKTPTKTATQWKAHNKGKKTRFNWITIEYFYFLMNSINKWLLLEKKPGIDENL